ncbi:protein ripply1-like [Hemiscyllium ocellatum]|uniref:protein ripply1-like n=1 Tax=Hemiscyllium ocellatum TaxID=170820 RepID=UPI0029669EB8|nr:protein ripply1-like [Hemiscyllium ocellatum]
MEGNAVSGARSRLCCCLHDPSAQQPGGLSAGSVWRPWLVTPKDIAREQQKQMITCKESGIYSSPKILTFLSQLNVSESERTQRTLSGDKVPAFRHPVKLLWPKSKQFDYLYEDAAHLLANFPVQATISFYQESDSESENEDDS